MTTATRHDGRAPDQTREVRITRNWLDHAEGSVLVEFGRTRVLCAASFTEGVPRWLKGQGKGWVTAEYAMLPRSTNTRSDRESVKGKIGGRTHEISRLVGRSLRAVIDKMCIRDRLPHESLIYFGDTARTPYGPRPISQVREFALECLDHLVDRGVKALVIACKTASAAMLHDARERYDVPVVEVIRPAVRRAAAATRSNRVGVISTLGTHNSRAYPDTFAPAPHIAVTSQPCPRFVEFVESGVTGGEELLAVAREYLAPLQEAEADTRILGCTPYPLLTGVISYVMRHLVTLASSAEETAQDL